MLVNRLVSYICAHEADINEFLFFVIPLGNHVTFITTLVRSPRQSPSASPLVVRTSQTFQGNAPDSSI